MRLPLDAPLIDKVFQPMADRLGDHGYTFITAARFLLDTSCLTQLASTVAWVMDGRRANISWPLLLTASAVVGAATIAVVVCGRFYLDLLSGLRTGSANPARVQLAFARMYALAMTAMHSVETFIDPNQLHFLDVVGYLALAGSLYFASCERRPPRRKSARVKLFGLWRVAPC